MTPADVDFGRGETILLKRERIKRDTIQYHCLQHHKKAADFNPTDDLVPPLCNAVDYRDAYDDGQ